MLFIAACAGIVIAPFLFESYTFHLYTISDPDFFTFSGARLWFFLASELALGFAVGRTSKLPPFVAAGCVATASLVLMSLLYQFCDTKQCYYSGPDGASWLRLGVLLFATSITGLLAGLKSNKGPERKSRASAVLFGAAVAIFLGYYPVSLLFGTFLTFELALALLAFASTVPFLLAGVTSLAFSDSAKHTVYSALIGWGVLVVLSASLSPERAPLLAAMIAIGVPTALFGNRIARSKRKERAIAASFSSTIALFLLMAVHPLLDAPMNLAVNDSRGVIAQPTYYAGAYHDERYFPTKRVEVEIDLQKFDGSMIRGQDFVLAGIGAQSPNCCKDGLDYGYRADILFTENGRYLVARAWETCDQNAGCSGFPWISTMHESTVPLPGNHMSVMLAMEWDRDDITAHWYYRTDGNWTKYSSFVSPEIENPYFNLGVIWVGSPTANPDLQQAYFYQAGVSTPTKQLQYGQITFDCPSYYDKQGEKQCPPLTPVKGGNSHWKVLWKWGVPDENARVEVQGTTVTVG